mgnify:CR=1 FL=1
MFKKFFKKNDEKNEDYKNILITALMIHAAKIDDNYTNDEKKIITKALLALTKLSIERVNKIIISAEKKELESNQIIEFTKEIKKETMEYRLKILELLWQIIYSDGTSDMYEANLMRRICGLLYISDKDSGIIKSKLKK